MRMIYVLKVVGDGQRDRLPTGPQLVTAEDFADVLDEADQRYLNLPAGMRLATNPAEFANLLRRARRNDIAAIASQTAGRLWLFFAENRDAPAIVTSAEYKSLQHMGGDRYVHQRRVSRLQAVADIARLLSDPIDCAALAETLSP